MNRLFLLGVMLIGFSTVLAKTEKQQHTDKTLEIYRAVIEIPTVKGRGKTPEMAQYLSNELQLAGFPKEDIHIIPTGKTASLIVQYRGQVGTGKKPILFLGHMDVVEAYEKDWVRHPFKLTEDDINFYARGSIDNKLGVTMLTSTFIRLKNQNYVPDRDLFLVFSGDEETDMKTTMMLAQHPMFADAEYALNSDAGGGDLSPNGKPLAYLVQSAEKTYVTFEITTTNIGGHSSRPRKDNAIYELVDALKNIQAYEFPVQSSPMTLEFFRITGEQMGGELGQSMIDFSKNPRNMTASNRISQESSYVGTVRTTCITTMLRAGHAENALPQSATATVNCRVFPGTSAKEVEKTLHKVANDKNIKIEVIGDVTESPISELRSDVLDAIGEAVSSRYPGINIIGYMESGGTDGMHFRKAGIPTWAVSSIFMDPNEMYAHGLNERLPKKAFYDGLDHWTVLIKKLTRPR